MSPTTSLVLIVLLGASMYGAGRLQARIGYRFGYRFGYRQGYFDGDRACWNRRRREAQVAVESALAMPPHGRADARTLVKQTKQTVAAGTTYQSAYMTSNRRQDGSD